MFKKRYPLMEEAGDAGAAAGAAGSDAGAAAAGADSAAASAAAASVLATGAAAETAGDAGNTDYIPEKLRVNKADGTLDVDGSSRKMAEAYGALEKRLGSGDAPPAAAADYKVAVPEAFKESIDPATDPGIKGFLDGAHAAGMNQAQVDFVMGQYFTMAPQLVAGAGHLDEAGATAELKKVWVNDSEFKRNVNNAFAGATAIAQKAGLNIDDVMSANGLGNNVTFLRLMAAIGPEFKEDTSIGGAKITAEADIAGLMASPAYTDPKNPEHAKVSAQVAEYYKRKFGTDSV